jgi:hypothetical protein
MLVLVIYTPFCQLFVMFNRPTDNLESEGGEKRVKMTHQESEESVSQSPTVLNTPMFTPGDSEESEEEWEAVDETRTTLGFPQYPNIRFVATVETSVEAPRRPSESLEIEMNSEEIKQDGTSNKSKVKYTKEDRLVREEMHKLHLMCLLASVILRNRLCSSDDLAVRLLEFACTQEANVMTESCCAVDS